jgi:beta-glucanase (GH16 family)
LANGTISLETLVGAFDLYNIPGDFAAVGLANGTDQNNAIEIVGFATSGSLTCRTVSGGSATQTNVTVPALNHNLYEYEIIAKPSVVQFYVNGALVATHTTNIPTTPLNALFTVSTPGGGGSGYGLGLYVSTTSFRQRPQ